MLDFPEHFFENQEREGFLVDSTMKTVWAAELEVLQEIAIICNRHNLQWYAWCGTLLGAVRHGGFVPWDDDIDIMMKREDYMELLKYLPEELPAGYDVRCSLIEVEDEAEEYQCTVFNARSVSIAPERLKRFHGCPFIVGVDIFPLDYVNRDPRIAEYQREKFRLLRQTAWVIKHEEDTPENRAEIEEALKTINAHCGTNLKRGNSEKEDKVLVNKIWKIANETAMENDRRSGEYIVQFMNYARNEEKIYPKAWFADVTYLQFEHIMMPVPIGYENVLRTKYGDYSIIKKMTSSHEYPVYKKQLEKVREIYTKFEEAAAKDAEAERKWKEENRGLYSEK